MLGRWNFPSELREGKTPQTQPPVETKEKEYTRRLTRRSNSNVLAHFSSIRVFTVCYSLTEIQPYFTVTHSEVKTRRDEKAGEARAIKEFLYDIDFLRGYSRYTVGPFFCGILYSADVISHQTNFNPTDTTTAETKTTIHPTPPLQFGSR